MSFSIVSSNLGAIRRDSFIPYTYLASSRPSYHQSQRRTFCRYTHRSHNAASRALGRMHDYRRHLLSIVRHHKAAGSGHRPWTGTFHNGHTCQFRRWKSNSRNGPRGPHRPWQDDWAFRDPWEFHRNWRQRRMQEIEREIEKDPYTALFGQSLDPLAYRDFRHGSWSEVFRAFLGVGLGDRGRPSHSNPTTITITNPRTKTGADTRPSGSGSKINNTEDKDPSSAENSNAKKSEEGSPQQTATKTDAKAFKFDPISNRMIPVTSHPLRDSDGDSKKGDGRSVGTSENSQEAESGGNSNNNVRTINNEISDRSQESIEDPQNLRHHELQGSGSLAPSASSHSEINPSSESADSSCDENKSSGNGMHRGKLAAEASGPPPETIPEGTDVSQTSEKAEKPKMTDSTADKKQKTSQQLENSLDNLQEREESEDLDLLRADDIRVPYHSKKGKQELDAQKQKRREALEADFVAFTDITDDVHADVRSASQGHDNSKTVERKKAQETSGSPDIERPRKDPVSLKEDQRQDPQPTSYQTDNHRPLETDNDRKVDTSTSTDTHQPPTQSSPKVQEPTKQPRQNESANSSQAPESPPPSSAQSHYPSPSPPTTYRVLAYDLSTRQVTTAETTSSQYAKESVHPADVLPCLNNPAKFLPHFAAMRQDGYEIVSGGGDILVFKKTRHPEAAPDAAVDDEKSATTTATAKSSASPQTYGSTSDGAAKEGDLNKPNPKPTNNTPRTENENDSSSPNQATRLVRRQETVFTGGPPNWSPYISPSSSSPPPSSSASQFPNPSIPEDSSHPNSADSKEGGSSRTPNVLSRVLFTGAATAATCYAVGVVGEYFRTGGEDGRGFDAFTVFESERRRNERDG